MKKNLVIGVAVWLLGTAALADGKGKQISPTPVQPVPVEPAPTPVPVPPSPLPSLPGPPELCGPICFPSPQGLVCISFELMCPAPLF